MLTLKTNYLETLPNFLAYFGTAVALTALFLLLYTLVTPHREWQLIRAGNNAAAISLAGASIGFAIPFASVIVQSQNLLDMVVWAIVVLVVQLCAFLVARILKPGLSRRIEAGDTAHGTVLATISLTAGILNAACMTY
jgi:putative membrane protein